MARVRVDIPVKETELAIKFRLREIVGTDFEPGLHFMIPWINTVQKFERRVLTRNYPAEPFLTSEGKILNVDFFVKWRVSDVGQFYLATNGDEEAAAGRLAEIVKDGLKGVIAKRTIQQVVAAERSEFIGDILQVAGASVGPAGRHAGRRARKAHRPAGGSLRVRIQPHAPELRSARPRSCAPRATSRRSASAPKRSASAPSCSPAATAMREVIRGEGDAQAAATYARAYQRFPEFYSLHRSLEAYRNSIGQPNDVLVIAPKGEFFKYLKQSGR